MLSATLQSVNVVLEARVQEIEARDVDGRSRSIRAATLRRKQIRGARHCNRSAWFDLMMNLMQVKVTSLPMPQCSPNRRKSKWR